MDLTKWSTQLESVSTIIWFLMPVVQVGLGVAVAGLYLDLQVLHSLSFSYKDATGRGNGIVCQY